MAGKVTDTVVAFNHVHVESALIPKLNSALHGHVRTEKPDASVRESKVTNTACPLSENRADRGRGAGIDEAEESNLTLTFWLEYSVELVPEKSRSTTQSPEVLGLPDKIKYPANDDTLVNSIDAGVASTISVGIPSRVMEGVTVRVLIGALGISYEKMKVVLLALLYFVASE